MCTYNLFVGILLYLCMIYSDPQQTIGCSTKTHPTRKFIQVAIFLFRLSAVAYYFTKGHAKLYMKDGDNIPLLPVMHGGGKCSLNSDCGNFGVCSDRHECDCFNDTYTGPHCLVTIEML